MNEPQGANKMKIFTVSIFGHWQFGDFFLSEKLEKGIRELLITKEYLEFGGGCDGEFYRFAASTILKCKRTI